MTPVIALFCVFHPIKGKNFCPKRIRYDVGFFANFRAALGQNARVHTQGKLQDGNDQGYLEGHSRTCKWLITMVIVSPLRIGLWDPIQMAEIYGL